MRVTVSRSVIARVTGSVKDERGVAMVVALVALVIGLLLATTVVMAATGEGFLSNRDTAAKRAFEAAQGGLQQTVYEMNTLLNSASIPASTLEGQCVAGASASVNAAEVIAAPTLNFSTGANLNLDCASDTQSLGNGAFYTSWTSIVLGLAGANPPTCAGTTVGITQLVTDRCIVSEGIVCPPSFTTPTCPNPVTRRVEERVAAATGKPLFPIQGVVAPNGTLIKNSAQILGNLSTNLQASLQNTAQVTTPLVVAGQPAGPWPLISNSALLGTGLVCNSTNATVYTLANSWPTACVTRFTDPTTGQPSKITLLDDVPPFANFTDDGRITCAINNACAHDTFSTSSGPCLVNSNGCAQWNQTTRSLTIPNGVTWTIGGGTYNFCTFSMTGGNAGTQALLGAGVKTQIFIDSPANHTDPNQNNWCPSGSGTITVGNGAAFVNNSPPLPGSPLAHDTTAFFIDIYGQIPQQTISDTQATYINNDCNLNGNTKDASCVQLGQSTNFYGTVYAPESDVYIGNTGSTYGGIAGRTVTFDNPGTFTQDVNVTKLITTATQALYFRTAWIQCYSQPTSATDPMSGC
jgi:Tfp pilus assembly protein PilX